MVKKATSVISLIIFSVAMLCIGVHFEPKDVITIETHPIPAIQQSPIRLTPELREKQENRAKTYFKKMEYLDKIKTDSVEWLEVYEAVNKEYDDITDELSTLENTYTDEEIQYLYRCVETETCGSDIASRSHVAKVIMNRVNDERFPNTITDVVTQPNQFCYSKTNISEETKAACKFAVAFPNDADDCLWFHSGKQTTTFSGGKFVFQDSCGHNFYS